MHFLLRLPLLVRGRGAQRLPANVVAMREALQLGLVESSPSFARSAGVAPLARDRRVMSVRPAPRERSALSRSALPDRFEADDAALASTALHVLFGLEAAVEAAARCVEAGVAEL